MLRVLIAGLVVAASLACAGGKGKGGHDGDEGVQADPVTVVKVEPAALGEVAAVLSTTAVVESESAADIYPSTTGVVRSVHREEGDSVRAGDVLAVLENVSLDASAERASDELQRLEEQYAQLRALQERGAVSDRDLEDVAYQLQSARTSAREASRSHGQTRLTAPFAGVVAARDVRVGELATSGSRAFQVVDLDALRVVSSVPERDLPRVRAGQSARLISAYDESHWAPGTVVRVAPVVDASSGTFRVTVSIDSAGALRPGQFVRVEIEVERLRDVLVVPAGAVVWEDGSPVVYTMVEELPEKDEEEEADEEASEPGWEWPWVSKKTDDSDDEEAAEVLPDSPFVARRVRVQLGLVDDMSAQVVNGLEPGDEVVTLGQSHLRDGTRIRVADSPPAEEADLGAEETGPGDRG